MDDFEFNLGTIEPYFLSGGDKVCYKKKFYTVYGSYAMFHNNKLAVIHNLMDKHVHMYALLSDTTGDILQWIPREEIQFIQRYDSDNQMLQSCYGLMRKFSDLPVTHPEDVLDPNTREIEDGTYCLYVSNKYGSVFNCKTVSHIGDIYTIELENGLIFEEIDRSLIYINEMKYFRKQDTE